MQCRETNREYMHLIQYRETICEYVRTRMQCRETNHEFVRTRVRFVLQCREFDCIPCCIPLG